MKAVTKGKVIKRGVPPMALFWKKPATPAKNAGKGMCPVHDLKANITARPMIKFARTSVIERLEMLNKNAFQ